jgi:hypothetical protein
VGLSDSQLGKLLKITKYRWQEVNGLGRKRLHPAGNKVLASLQTSGRVTLTAQEHGVSRGSIRNALKAIGVTPADVIKKIATKDNTLLHNGGLND